MKGNYYDFNPKMIEKLNIFNQKIYEISQKESNKPVTNELMPIIVDSSVDPKFGSGVVKITPAHSTSDYEVGK